MVNVISPDCVITLVITSDITPLVTVCVYVVFPTTVLHDDITALYLAEALICIFNFE